MSFWTWFNNLFVTQPKPLITAEEYAKVRADLGQALTELDDTKYKLALKTISLTQTETQLQDCNSRYEALASDVNVREAAHQKEELQQTNQILEEQLRTVETERSAAEAQTAMLANTITDLKMKLVELQKPVPGLTPPEALVEILVKVEPTAFAWYELASILADHMKVRAVQTTEVKATEVADRLKMLFPNAVFHRMRDDSYFLPTKEKGLEILSRDWSNLISYIAQRRDCDKFATIFKAHLSLHYGLNNAVEVWSPWHSFILLMFSDGDLLLEPQTDLTFKVSEVSTALYEVNEVFA